MWEGMLSSKLMIDVISKPKRYGSSTSPKVHVSGSQRTRNSLTHVDLRPFLIRLGSERAKIWRMAAVAPEASLPRSGSTDVWIFLFRPELFGMMCSVIRDGCGGPLWVWTCDARSIAL